MIDCRNKPIALFCNPTSEGVKAVALSAKIAGELAARKIPFVIFVEQWPDSLTGFCQAWIIGGDGTLNHFINQYEEISLPLSIFEGGTGNDFHWMLYGALPWDLQLAKILQGTTRLVDAGRCNGRLFLNGVGIGFDGAIVKDLLGKKKLAGKSSYLLSILKNIIGYSEKDYQLEFNGQRVQRKCFMISVANGKRYGGGFYVAPQSSVFDGKLDVNIVGPVRPLKRIKLLPVIEKGAHLQLEEVQYQQTTQIKIESSHPVAAHIDGEYLSSRIFEIDCLAKSFLFCV